MWLLPHLSGGGGGGWGGGAYKLRTNAQDSGHNYISHVKFYLGSQGLVGHLCCLNATKSRNVAQFFTIPSHLEVCDYM